MTFLLAATFLASPAMAPVQAHGAQSPNFAFTVQDISDRPQFVAGGFIPEVDEADESKEEQNTFGQVQKLSKYKYFCAPMSFHHKGMAWVTRGSQNPVNEAKFRYVESAGAVYEYTSDSAEPAEVHFFGWAFSKPPEVDVFGSKIDLGIIQNTGVYCSLGASAYVQQRVEFNRVPEKPPVLAKIGLGIGAGVGPISIGASVPALEFELSLPFVNGSSGSSVQVERLTPEPTSIEPVPAPFARATASGTVYSFQVEVHSRIAANIEVAGLGDPSDNPFREVGQNWGPMSAGVRYTGSGNNGYIVFGSGTPPGYLFVPVHPGPNPIFIIETVKQPTNLTYMNMNWPSGAPRPGYAVTIPGVPGGVTLTPPPGTPPVPTPTSGTPPLIKTPIPGGPPGDDDGGLVAIPIGPGWIISPPTHTPGSEQGAGVD